MSAIPGYLVNFLNISFYPPLLLLSNVSQKLFPTQIILGFFFQKDSVKARYILCILCLESVKKRLRMFKMGQCANNVIINKV